MKKLKKILLINWLYFDRELIEVGDVNFLTGRNGAGKSTVIDALQIVLLGETNARNFNLAANERSQRTLDGYLRADMDENNPRSRRGKDFSSYIACEFYDDAERSSYEAALAAENAGTLCTGEHDGQSYTWTYDINTGRVCKSAGMMGGAAELNDGDALYGDYLPCVRSVWTSGNGDPNYYTTAEGGGIVFANSDGDLLNGITYASAGCFYDQPLAPVKIGDKWAYLDRKGNQVTQAVYDAVYGGLDFYEDYTPKYASPLLNGYAAICRDGKWGVLDAAGKEYIPCDYAGAAWNGHILWLQRDGHWQSRTLPGVPEHWQDAKMRFQVGPKELKATDAFWRVTAAGGLRLRVGPDTSYEKISLVPEYTALQELGRSEDGCWMLTLYGRWHGWVSMDHLEKITQ